MSKPWHAAGGEYQVLFMAATSRAARGDLGQCPRCRHATLRCYFHAFKVAAQQGTMWCWCPECRVFAHLPRVVPTGPVPQDPFSAMTGAEFAQLEGDPSTPFLDRLDQMWDQGRLVVPG